ncbi:MAG: glycosyltransferase [Acidobacteriota bacterium]|nr:glycosyltransferase [Acidobacteriota bacterium]
MKITHLTVWDLAGGAARAAYRLHTGLCRLGHDSRMLVQHRQSSDPRVISFQPPNGLGIKLRRAIKQRYLARQYKSVARIPGGSLFSDDRSPQNADVLLQMPESDILNLHWVAGFVDYREFFGKLPANLPVVWTLHDMNPFTGGCHFDGGCGKFMQRCGACPQLSSSDPDDPSSRSLERKREAYASLGGDRMHLVTPSRWMQAEVKKSALLSSLRCTTIPNGLDTDVFKPRDQAAARALLGIPVDGFVILFLADWAGETRKGFSVLVEALKHFSNDNRVHFLTVGRELPSADLGQRITSIPSVTDDKKLSTIYSAANVFVLPSLQDNLPNTALEALACGVPIVAFDSGGIPEIVRPGETGTLVPAGDVEGLGAAIAALLKNKEARLKMAEQGRQYALSNYALEVQARRYATLYSELTEKMCR